MRTAIALVALLVVAPSALAQRIGPPPPPTTITTEICRNFSALCVTVPATMLEDYKVVRTYTRSAQGTVQAGHHCDEPDGRGYFSCLQALRVGQRAREFVLQCWRGGREGEDPVVARIDANRKGCITDGEVVFRVQASKVQPETEQVLPETGASYFVLKRPGVWETLFEERWQCVDTVNDPRGFVSSDIECRKLR